MNGPSSKQDPDGLREIDADYGKKEYKEKREDGTIWNKGKSIAIAPRQTDLTRWLSADSKLMVRH